MANWQKHNIDFSETFDLRRPVLDAMSSLRNRWRVVDDGKSLEVDLPLGAYSPHERDVIEFAINPYVTGKNVFDGLSPEPRRALATAIHAMFGPGGAEDRG